MGKIFPAVLSGGSITRPGIGVCELTTLVYLGGFTIHMGWMEMDGLFFVYQSHVQRKVNATGGDVDLCGQRALRVGRGSGVCSLFFCFLFFGGDDRLVTWRILSGREERDFRG